VFEEYQVADSCCPCFHNVDVETLVMLNCHPDVETGVRVDVSGLSVLGFDVGHHRTSQRCKRMFHEVMLPMDMGMHRTFSAMLLCCSRLMVSSAGCMRRHHREGGNLSSTPLRMETKWFLNIWIARLAML
jgi:hypothetical protein